MGVKSYTLSEATRLSFDEAVERVRAELADEGFGVLCEIDVQATLRKKLGVEREPRHDRMRDRGGDRDEQTHQRHDGGQHHRAGHHQPGREGRGQRSPRHTVPDRGAVAGPRRAGEDEAGGEGPARSCHDPDHDGRVATGLDGGGVGGGRGHVSRRTGTSPGRRCVR